MTGASGLIGTALVAQLRSSGHEVLRLVRRPAAAPDEVSWDPDAGSVDPGSVDPASAASGRVDLDRLQGVTAAVHLAGAGVGDHRWTEAYRATIRDSRVRGTRTLAQALAALDPRPQVLVSASAVGFYGSRGDEVLTEESSGGTGFLADVVRDWEAATAPAAEAGIRVVHARTGLVLSRRGGALGQLLPLLRLGLGGRLGNGRQWWPWITLPDEVAALEFLLGSRLAGPVNLSAPNPLRNAELTAVLARAVHRPAILPVPAAALRIALGEFAGDVLASQRMLPERLLQEGFRFTHPTLEDAAAWLLGSD